MLPGMWMTMCILLFPSLQNYQWQIVSGIFKGASAYAINHMEGSETDNFNGRKVMEHCH